MAHQRDENFTDMSEDSEWILLEEKIYLLPGVLPRDENEYDMPVIGVNSNEKKRQSSIDHTSSFIEEIHKKNSRTAKVIGTSRTKAKAPPELISVNEVTMLTNPHSKKLVFFPNLQLLCHSGLCTVGILHKENRCWLELLDKFYPVVNGLQKKVPTLVIVEEKKIPRSKKRTKVVFSYRYRCTVQSTQPGSQVGVLPLAGYHLTVFLIYHQVVPFQVIQSGIQLGTSPITGDGSW